MLGMDGAICKGQNFQLQASGATKYYWTPAVGLSATNIAKPIASPDVKTTYYCAGDNIIVNGDFSLGNIGFTTGYSYAASTSEPWLLRNC